ncbi:class I SAM-dependent methyltransferase [Candidatus Gottesmanbacteria bacterium]|nr:class I SAM-dependent methyltransferase [Candidatus Gottesmanbacteria bacterium]
MADSPSYLENNLSHQLPSEKDRRAYGYQHTKLTWPGRVEETFGVSLLEQLKDLIPQGTILDIGSSIGDTTREMAHVFGDNVQVTGIEIDAGMFGEKGKFLQKLYKTVVDAKKRTYTQGGNPPQFVQADGYFPPFAENSFHAVFMMNNLYQSVQHFKISSEQLKVIVGNIRHITKPGGFFLVSGISRGADHPFVIFRFDAMKNATIFAESDHSSMAKDITDNPDYIFKTISRALGDYLIT